MLSALTIRKRNRSLSEHRACLVALFAAMTLSACEHQNEGAITTAHTTANRLERPYDQRFHGSNDLASLRLIESGDAYSVTILSIFVCNFHESGWLDATLSARASKPCDNNSGDGGGSPNTRGEIAVLADVTEGLHGSKGERVVYYNADVRESGQAINDKPISIQGPRIYNGKGLHLSIAMLELDNEENEATKGMISSLADAGAALYPPSSLALTALSKIGQSLLSGSQDDTEFRGSTTFDPPHAATPQSGVKRNPLAEGYVAFMRSEDRSEDLSLSSSPTDADVPKRNWNICPDQGEIRIGDCGNGILYRDRSWVLVRISKEDKSAASSSEIGETLTQLRERISNNNQVGQNISNVSTSVSLLAKAILEAEKAALEAQLSDITNIP